MKKIKLLKVLKDKKYLLLAVISSIIMFFIYVYVQLLGIFQNFDVWLKIIPIQNLVLLIAFLVLFGITFSYQVYLWRQPKLCSTGEKIKGAGTTSIPILGLLFVAQCPACTSFAILFLPLTTVAFISQISWIISLIAIGMLLFTLNYLGAFKE